MRCIQKGLHVEDLIIYVGTGEILAKMKDKICSEHCIGGHWLQQVFETHISKMIYGGPQHPLFDVVSNIFQINSLIE